MSSKQPQDRRTAPWCEGEEGNYVRKKKEVLKRYVSEDGKSIRRTINCMETLAHPYYS